MDLKTVERPKWSMIEITNEAIQAAAKTHDLSEENAFDFISDLLEKGEFAHLQFIVPPTHFYRIERDYLGIRDSRLLNYYRGPYPRKLRFGVHKAEDGRCEMCELPMDRRAARLQRLDVSVINKFKNYVLLCPDCNLDQPNPLESVLFSDEAIRSYQTKRKNTEEEAMDELQVTQKNLVLLNVKENTRRYWAPDLGNLQLENGILEFEKIYDSPVPVLQRKPQERSRRWA